MRYPGLFVLALAVLAACQGPTAPADPAALVSGTYSLRSIDGASLPAAIPDDGLHRSVAAGRIDICAEASTYVRQVTWSGPGGTVQTTDSGTLVPDGAGGWDMAGGNPGKLRPAGTALALTGWDWGSWRFVRD